LWFLFFTKRYLQLFYLLQAPAIRELDQEDIITISFSGCLEIFKQFHMVCIALFKIHQKHLFLITISLGKPFCILFRLTIIERADYKILKMVLSNLKMKARTE